MVSKVQFKLPFISFFDFYFTSIKSPRLVIVRLLDDYFRVIYFDPRTLEDIKNINQTNYPNDDRNNGQFKNLQLQNHPKEDDN